MDCKQESNRKICSCSFSCSRKGICCECLHYHRHLGELPACYFPDDIESTGDRGIERFINLYQKIGAWW
jgi:hypothetical protein